MSETKQLPIKIPKEEIEQFCQRHHIRKLSLFGSVLRDDFTPESDIDFLVEFEPEYIPGFIRLAGMEIELSEIVGRKADLRTAAELSPYFRQEVLDSAVVQYDKD
ncbi:MAG TPA: nucleotidyltransferase [Cyanobacteria bacterium UBA11162]|nr:nucleotidyltransferase [Cyanobacteria bacterium UBA11162]